LSERRFGANIVLGNTKHCPSLAPQLTGNPFVAFLVRLDLTDPEFAASLRGLIALWTSMPETPVNKDDQFPFGKHQVRVAK